MARKFLDAAFGIENRQVYNVSMSGFPMAKKKTIPRRTFTRNIAVGALAAGGITAWLAHEQPWHVPYQLWYDKNCAERRSSGEFMHPEFREEHIPSEEMKAEFAKAFSKYQKNSFAKIDTINYWDGKAFTEFSGNDIAFREFEARARAATKQFFQFVGIEKELPQLAFYRLTSATPIVKEKNALHYYVAGTMKEGHIAAYYGVLRSGMKESALLVRDKGDRSGGVFKTMETILLKANNDNFVLKDEVAPIILITAAQDAIMSYSSPPAEALHYALRSVRQNGTIEDLNTWLLSNGKQGEVEEHIEKFGREWLHREEGVVHALLDDFLEKQQARERFSAKEMSDYIHVAPKEPYHLVPLIRAALKTTTPAALLKEYRENPRGLFARLSP